MYCGNYGKGSHAWSYNQAPPGFDVRHVGHPYFDFRCDCGEKWWGELQQEIREAKARDGRLVREVLGMAGQAHE
jgi:hypothetical protein